MKCLCCREIFIPNPRNRHHQKFCQKELCRQASKRHSQQVWLAKPENKDHFRGAANVERVRQWRKEHPGYWRRRNKKPDGALQDVCHNQVAQAQEVAMIDPQDLFRRTLQDVCRVQAPLLVGLLSQMIDSPLQEDIVGFARRMVAKGQDLLDNPFGRSLNQTLPYDTKKTPPSRAAAPSPAAL